MKKDVYSVIEHSIFANRYDHAYVGENKDLAFETARELSLDDFAKIQCGSDISIFCNHEYLGFYRYGEFVPYKYANNALQK
jgi:hypothetical protein